MSISSIGISSGVLTSDLIDKLIAAEKEPTELRLDRKQEGVEAQVSAFGQIKSALSDLRIEARVLSKESTFNLLTVTSTNSAVSGSAGSSASAGTYTVETTQLAQAHSLASAEFSATTDVLDTGTLTLTSGTTSATITIDSSNYTVQGIADAINNESDLDVNASVLYTGTGYKLVLSAVESGLTNAVKVEVSGDGDGDDTDNAGLSQLLFDGTNDYLTETVAALDANVKINGVAITRDSNTITDAVTGLTLDLSATNSGSPAIVSIAQDATTMAENVDDFVEKFNELQTLYNEMTAYNPETGEGSVLLGDGTLRTVFTQIRSNVQQLVSGLAGEEIRSFTDVGLSTNSDTGLLIFNSTTFASMLSSYPDDMVGLFAVQGRTTDSNVEFTNNTSLSPAGTFAIDVTTMATQGVLTGTAITPPTTITAASNDTFALKVDGYQSGTITLDPATYTTGALLATEIEEEINKDSVLLAAGKSVTVSFDGSNQLVITSNSYGTSSTVEITTIEAATSTSLGLTATAGTAGVDVAGTINGKTATGSGQYLTGDDDTQDGIKVRVKGGTTGARGNVTLIRGIGDSIVDRIDEFFSLTGALQTRQDGLQKTLSEIDEDRLDLDDRLAVLQSRLALQFTSADILIGRLNNTADFLGNFFKSLNASDD